MQPIQDYMYRFPHEAARVSGRCRVRIYRNKRGSHVVLLTEVSNSGETITTAADRIATALVARWSLSPRTTQWIQHNPPEGDLPLEFARIKFSWNKQAEATDPQWEPLSSEQVEALTGESLNSINRRLGDTSLRSE